MYTFDPQDREVIVSISWQLIVLSLAYVGVLFVIAWHGDRNTSSFGGSRSARWVYPLSIGVYATSWTYYGAVGSAANQTIYSNNGVHYKTDYLFKQRSTLQSGLSIQTT
ncbi:MAG TPA: hypothetical protein DEO34_03580, partial [Gammaproteobacteria bacterium]|nr:hypothetical protein [Gammaproteobacteria bacterium]